MTARHKVRIDYETNDGRVGFTTTTAIGHDWPDAAEKAAAEIRQPGMRITGIRGIGYVMPVCRHCGGEYP